MRWKRQNLIPSHWYKTKSQPDGEFHAFKESVSLKYFALSDEIFKSVLHSKFRNSKNFKELKQEFDKQYEKRIYLAQEWDRYYVLCWFWARTFQKFNPSMIPMLFNSLLTIGLHLIDSYFFRIASFQEPLQIRVFQISKITSRLFRELQ